MICPGLHCPGCTGSQSAVIGGAGVVGLVLACETVQWVADRIWWIGGTVAACFAAAVAVSTALEARSERRGAAYAAAHGIMSRADALALGIVPPAVAGSIPERPAIEGGVHVHYHQHYHAAPEQAVQAVTEVPGQAELSAAAAPAGGRRHDAGPRPATTVRRS